MDGPIIDVSGRSRGTSRLHSDVSIRLELQPGITVASPPYRLLERRLLAVLPGVIIEDDPAENEIVLTTGHSHQPGKSLVEMKAEEFNALLAALPSNPVLDVSEGMHPMQLLVALAYRPVQKDLELLSGIEGVLHVALAEPECVYGGYVISLLVPCIENQDQWEAFHEKIVRQLSFDLPRAEPSD